MKIRGFQLLGGFRNLEESKIEKAKILMQQNQPTYSQKLSSYQTDYLLKIYEYCEHNNIKLILLNTPIHPMLEEIQQPLKENYCRFAQNHLPNSILVNHSDFHIAEEEYRDLGHLTFKGAEKYTNFLISDQFMFGLNKCSE